MIPMLVSGKSPNAIEPGVPMDLEEEEVPESVSTVVMHCRLLVQMPPDR